MRANMRVRERARVNARVKFKIAQNRLKFCLHTFYAIISIFIKIAQTRIFAAERKIITPQFVLTGYSSYFSEQFDTMFISLSVLITEWASVEDKYPCVRAHVLHSIYGQKHAYTMYIGMIKDCQFLFHI